MSIDSKILNIESQINEKRQKVDLLIKEALPFKTAIETVRKTLLTVKEESAKDTLYDRISELTFEIEYRKFSRLQAEAQIERLHIQKLQIEATEIRQHYEKALDSLPQISANYEASRNSFENLNAQLTSMTNDLTNRERRAQEHFEKAQLLEEKIIQYM